MSDLIENMAECLAKKERRIADLTAENMSLTQEIAELVEGKAKLAEECAAKTDRIAELEKDKTRLEAENTRRRVEFDAIKETLRLLSQPASA